MEGWIESKGAYLPLAVAVAQPLRIRKQRSREGGMDGQNGEGGMDGWRDGEKKKDKESQKVKNRKKEKDNPAYLAYLPLAYLPLACLSLRKKEKDG